MPQVRLFNPTGREIFPPRPLNSIEADSDRTRLRIIVVPPNHFLPAKIDAEPHTAPIIVGGAIPIVADDAESVRLPDGSVAQPLNDVLHVPTFYGPDAFPEPEIAEVVEEPAPVATGYDDSNNAPTGTPHIMTEAEKQALEAEYEALVAARQKRLNGVNIIPFEQPEIITNDPTPLVHTPQWRRPKRKKDEIIAELLEAIDDEPDEDV